MKINYLCAVLAFIFLSQLSFAQSEKGRYSITGIVVDSVSKEPLDLITVQLGTGTDRISQMGYTKPNGLFELTVAESGKYVLYVSGVGYKTYQTEVDFAVRKTIALGMIPLTPEALDLKEVTVTAAKPIVTQQIDRLTYDLQADPESKVYSVLEMMQKVPLLSLDADNTLYMKGTTDFRILINGKPSGMVERNYKEVLRSMPASTIERIEVITTPPSKYDAEGLAGIINIITNRNIENGYRGSVNLSERFPVGGPGVGGSVSAKLGKLGMTGFMGGSLYRTPEIMSWINRTTLTAETSYLIQTSSTLSNSRSAYAGYEVSYEFDSLNLISGQFNINANRSAGSGSQQTERSSGDEILQRYVLASTNGGGGSGMDASFNYQRGFKSNKNRLLTFSYRYAMFGNEHRDTLRTLQRIHYDLPDYQQTNNQNFYEQTIQADLVYPIRKLNMEAGLKAILRNNESDFQARIYNSDNDRFELFPAYTNKFANTQNVFGAYNSYQFAVKKWSVKAGARVEQTVMLADFVSTQSKAEQNYFNVIPSLAINRNFKKGRGINFGYSQRIQRPGIYQLNPFVDRSNPNFERTGNPGLRPALVNDFQLRYSSSAKVSVSMGLGATYFRDLIFQVSYLDPVTGITRISYENTGWARLLMGNLNVSYPISKKWSSQLNARAAYGKVEGVVNGARITNSGLMYNINFSTGYRFEKNWRVTANLTANGPNVNLQGTSNAMVSYSGSVNKEVIKDKLTLSAAFNNPFTRYRIDQRESFGPNFLQTNDRRDYFRSFAISLNYKFGRLKAEIRKNRRGIHNDDIQNGS